MQLLTIIAIFFAVGGVLFAMQNNMPVTVSLAIWEYQGSLALVLLLTLALGVLVTGLASTPGTLRMQWRLKRQQSRIDRLETERSALEERIRELEQLARGPVVDGEVAPAEKPYIGLKQMLTGTPPHESTIGSAPLARGDTGDGKA